MSSDSKQQPVTKTAVVRQAFLSAFQGARFEVDHIVAPSGARLYCAIATPRPTIPAVVPRPQLTRGIGGKGQVGRPAPVVSDAVQGPAVWVMVTKDKTPVTYALDPQTFRALVGARPNPDGTVDIDGEKHSLSGVTDEDSATARLITLAPPQPSADPAPPSTRTHAPATTQEDAVAA